MHRTLARISAALSFPVLALVAAPAFAHVTVWSPDATQEGWGKAVFRVPNESEDATTTSITITLPTDTPFVGLRVQPKDGWSAEIMRGELPKPITVDGTKITEAITEIIWTADAGTGIGPGEFDEFAVSGGPFPKTDEVVFEVAQYYSDDTVADWDGAADSESPAPTLALALGDGDGHGHSDAQASGTDSSGSDSLARVLAASALGVAVGAFVLGARRRRA